MSVPHAMALSYHLRKHNIKYDDYIVKHDHAGIWPTCLNCDVALKRKLGGFGKFCSKKCASSKKFNGMTKLTGPLSPNFGQKRDPSQCENYRLSAIKRWDDFGDQLREGRKTVEYREMMRATQLKNYQENPERADKIRQGIQKFLDSPEAVEYRKQASIRACDLLEANLIGPQAPFKTSYIINPDTGQAEYMHSSWEAEFMQWSITNNRGFTKNHGLRIEYQDEAGKTRLYIPDFISHTSKHLIEIKGYESERDLCKKDAAQLWCDDNGYQYVCLQDFQSLTGDMS